MSYQAYSDFTAQSANIQTLMAMLSDLDKSNDSAVRVIPIVVFMAFSIEAYINSVGARAIPYWGELERLPWKKKLGILHQAAGKTAKWGEGDLQFASSVFNLRDNLAHGKPERVVGPIFETYEEAYEHRQLNRLEPVWWAKLNKAWAVKARVQFNELMKYVAALHSLHESDHLMLATGGMLHDDQN
jgi:hypothetical protein